jgi:hypothetical protein
LLAKINCQFKEKISNLFKKNIKIPLLSPHLAAMNSVEFMAAPRGEGGYILAAALVPGRDMTRC